MFKKVLVTLDGSSLAETVLPYVESLSSSTTDVILLRVVPPSHGLPSQKSNVPDYVVEPMSGSYWQTAEPRDRPAHMNNDYWYQDKESSRHEDEAKDYLAKVGERLEKSGFMVELVVLLGAPADEIVDYAAKAEVNLIAMCTHGRSGIGRWVYGSVADKVLRAATIPVLLVRASTESR